MEPFSFCYYLAWDLNCCMNNGFMHETCMNKGFKVSLLSPALPCAKAATGVLY